MKLDDFPTAYLNGEIIDSSAVFKLGDKIFDTSRENAILRILQNSGSTTVVDLGACDHKFLIDFKIRRGEWLHKILTDNCAQCIGFDIDKESVEHCHSIGYNNIHLLDMTSQYEEVYAKLSVVKKWDYLIAGEMVEHLDNPVEFLSRLNHNYKDRISKILITVPNVLNFYEFGLAIQGKEGINSDHRYWFTPYTICKVVHRAGFKLRELLYIGDRNLKINDMGLYFDDSTISGDLILIADFQ